MKPTSEIHNLSYYCCCVGEILFFEKILWIPKKGMRNWELKTSIKTSIYATHQETNKTIIISITKGHNSGSI
jgi:hypothetical protein